MTYCFMMKYYYGDNCFWYKYRPTFPSIKSFVIIYHMLAYDKLNIFCLNFFAWMGLVMHKQHLVKNSSLSCGWIWMFYSTIISLG